MTFVLHIRSTKENVAVLKILAEKLGAKHLTTMIVHAIARSNRIEKDIAHHVDGKSQWVIRVAPTVNGKNLVIKIEL